MPTHPSLISLHLRYRLWIAELNLDINVIRIYNDYLQELSAKEPAGTVKNTLKHFEQLLVTSRTEIDALRDEMHLLKMKLAAVARKEKDFDNAAYKSDDHAALKNKYQSFRKNFEKLKTDLSDFVVEALQ